MCNNYATSDIYFLPIHTTTRTCKLFQSGIRKKEKKKKNKKNTFNECLNMKNVEGRVRVDDICCTVLLVYWKDKLRDSNREHHLKCKYSRYAALPPPSPFANL